VKNWKLASSPQYTKVQFIEKKILKKRKKLNIENDIKTGELKV